MRLCNYFSFLVSSLFVLSCSLWLSVHLHGSSFADDLPMFELILGSFVVAVYFSLSFFLSVLSAVRSFFLCVRASGIFSLISHRQSMDIKHKNVLGLKLYVCM